MTWWLPGWPSPCLLSAYWPLVDTFLYISPVSFLATLQGCPCPHCMCVFPPCPYAFCPLPVPSSSPDSSIFLLWVSAQLKPPPVIFQVGLGGHHWVSMKTWASFAHCIYKPCTSGVLFICLLWAFFSLIVCMLLERAIMFWGLSTAFLGQWLSHWNQSINAS